MWCVCVCLRACLCVCARTCVRRVRACVRAYISMRSCMCVCRGGGEWSMEKTGKTNICFHKPQIMQRKVCRTAFGQSRLFCLLPLTRTVHPCCAFYVAWLSRHPKLNDPSCPQSVAYVNTASRKKEKKELPSFQKTM